MSWESILLIAGGVLVGLVLLGVYLWWNITVTGELEGWPDKAEKRDGPPELHPDLKAVLRRHERWRARRQRRSR